MCDPSFMEFGVVIPHNEIGTDPGAITAFAQGAEELGAGHLMIYDHVLGAQRDRPGGFRAPTTPILRSMSRSCCMDFLPHALKMSSW